MRTYRESTRVDLMLALTRLIAGNDQELCVLHGSLGLVLHFEGVREPQDVDLRISGKASEIALPEVLPWGQELLRVQVARSGQREFFAKTAPVVTEYWIELIGRSSMALDAFPVSVTEYERDASTAERIHGILVESATSLLADKFEALFKEREGVRVSTRSRDLVDLTLLHQAGECASLGDAGRLAMAYGTISSIPDFPPTEWKPAWDASQLAFGHNESLAGAWSILRGYLND